MEMLAVEHDVLSLGIANGNFTPSIGGPRACLCAFERELRAINLHFTVNVEISNVESPLRRIESGSRRNIEFVRPHGGAPILCVHAEHAAEQK